MCVAGGLWPGPVCHLCQAVGDFWPHFADRHPSGHGKGKGWALGEEAPISSQTRAWGGGPPISPPAPGGCRGSLSLPVDPRAPGRSLLPPASRQHRDIPPVLLSRFQELGIKHPLHRKKLVLAVKAINAKQEEKSALLDHIWVTRKDGHLCVTSGGSRGGPFPGKVCLGAAVSSGAPTVTSALHQYQ